MKNLILKSKIVYLIGMLLLLSMIMTSWKGFAQEDDVTRIGPSIYSVTFLGAAYGHDEEGTPLVYSVSSNGNPAVFNVIHGETGELIDHFELANAAGAWGITAVPGGDVYIASYNSAYLFRYTPGGDTIQRLDIPSPESVLYSPTYDEQGRVYFGSYPNAKVIMYDPAADEFKDYGNIKPGRHYTRSISYSNGKIYAGIAIPASLVEVDVETGEKRDIPLPEKFQNSDEAYDVDVIGNKLFVRMMKDYTLIIYDLESGEWIKEVPYTLGLHVSPADKNGNVYFRTNTASEGLSDDQNIHIYNPETNELTDTGFRLPAAPRALGWLNLEHKDFPGSTLVGVDSRGTISHYNPETGHTNLIYSEAIGIPNGLNALERGPDGNIYIGGYLSPQGAARYNPNTEQLTQLPGLSQVEGMGRHDGKMYFGVYSQARLFEYDPNYPWVYGTNPIEIFSLFDVQQDRPYAITSAGDYVAVGTTPTYGHLGGTLTLYDPETKEMDVFRNVVQDQSVIALAYQDGLIYGATQIDGGIGVDPTATEAKLFVFDPASKEKVWEGVPIANQHGISSLTFDSEGYLWGLASGKVFKFNPKTRTVLLEKELFPHSGYYKGKMALHTDGYIYGNTLNRVFKFDPESLEVETLLTGATHFAQDEYGDIYFVRDSTDLYKLDMSQITAESILESIEVYKIEGAFANEGAYRSLRTHMTSVQHFADKGEVDKVKRHMNGFIMLLENQWMNGKIQEDAYQSLLSDAIEMLNLDTQVFSFRELPVVEATLDTRYMEEVDALLFRNNQGPGHHVTFSFEVEESAEYEIDLQAFKATSYGIYDIKINGHSVGEHNFYNTSNGAGPFDKIATLFLEKGEHQITFENVGKDEASSDYYISLMYLKLKERSPFSSIVYEFPELDVTDATTDYRHFSNSGTIQFEAEEAGHSLSFKFKVTKADRYQIRLKPFKAPSYGIYDVLIDGKFLTAFDFYGTSGADSTLEILGDMELAEGEHTISFVGTGKRQDATNYKLGVIQLELKDYKGGIR